MERPVFQIRKDPLKRAFDILFSASVLIIGSPLYFLLALLIKLSSPGPIFYKSRRLGRGGKIIECLKFRSMYPDADRRLLDLLRANPSLKKEWETFQKFKQDPRITPIGRFLRKTSLDELPQFWNVLKGDLSVVGPRPPTLLGSSEEFLAEIIALYKEKTLSLLSVRPGITGIWQVSGRSEIPIDKRAQIEEKYIYERTFFKDLLIIAKTIPSLFTSKGAF